jgi:DNA polymerase III delta subunit
MIAYVGNNLFRMSQEADKIVTFLQYTNQKALSNTDRDAIIYTPIQVNAFGVLDAILEDKLENAMNLIDASAQSMTARPEFL